MNSARRVLIANERFLPRYGHDRSLVLLGRELVSRGHNVSFACLRCEHHVLAAISRDINQLNLPDEIELSMADRLAAEMIEATWVQKRPDILVTGGWPFFELAARSAAHGVPSLFIDAGAVPHDGYGEPSLSLQRELRRLRQRTMPFIDRILPNSDFTRESQTLPDHGYEGGVTTVLHGADHLDMGFDPAGIDIDSERDLVARLDALCQAGSPLIISLGRFEGEGYKNSPMVFDVFRNIRMVFSSAFLLILAGPATVAVPPDIVEHTICLSTLSDATLQAVMRRCKLGLTMSLWEGFNAPLAEMQLIGHPVLAFNIGAHPEVVADPWFLCSSPADMARKAARILAQGVPATIVNRRRFERARERLRWGDTFVRWTTEIEKLAGSPGSAAQAGRRFVLIDLTTLASGSANSDEINLARRLAVRLSENPTLLVVVGIWDDVAGGYALPTASHRSHLENFDGPKDWLGRIIEQFGHYVALEDILGAADPRCPRPPVLFFPEVPLNGSVQQRVAWGRERNFRLAFILHDMLPAYQREYIDQDTVDAFPRYLEALLQADAVWASSRFTLSEFERYCDERRAVLATTCEAVSPPGNVGESRMPALAPNTNEIRILCVSPVEPRRNHRGLIEAFERLRLKRPELPLRLILVGDECAGAADLAGRVRAAANRDDRIEWREATQQTDLETEFAHATFTVYPSLVEGFGSPILESLWRGRPCLCHEVGVTLELAADGGCMTVDMNDPIEISIAMERLCVDPALIDALRRQTAARELSTWSNYGDAIARLLERL
jgi:glycosyltransferase involved in cell wall biosynthesis